MVLTTPPKRKALVRGGGETGPDTGRRGGAVANERKRDNGLIGADPRGQSGKARASFSSTTTSAAATRDTGAETPEG